MAPQAFTNKEKILKPEIWTKFDAKFENYSQLHLRQEADLKINYLIYRCLIKQKKEFLWDNGIRREIQVLMIFHKYDT